MPSSKNKICINDRNARSGPRISHDNRDAIQPRAIVDENGPSVGDCNLGDWCVAEPIEAKWELNRRDTGSSAMTLL